VHENFNFKNECVLYNFCSPQAVHRILSFATFPDLKNHRLVSKSWNTHCTQILQTRSIVNLASLLDIQEFCLHHSKNPPTWCTTLGLGPQIPVLTECPELTLLFTTFGSKLQSLLLTVGSFNVYFLYRMLYEFCPHLSELRIHASVPINPTDELFKTKLIKNSNGHIPNPFVPRFKAVKEPVRELVHLKTLHVQLESSKTPALLQDLLNAAINLNTLVFPQSREYLNHALFQTPSLKHLKSLHIMDCPLGDQDIARLTNRQFPLETLDVILSPCVSPNSLQGLLRSLASTLTTLTLEYEDSKCGHIEFTPGILLSKVHTLELSNYRGSADFLLCQEWPALKTVILRKTSVNHLLRRLEGPAGAHNNNNNNNNNSNNNNVDTLRVHDDPDLAPEGVGDEAVEKLAMLFPNLKTLALERVGDEGLAAILFCWDQQQLRELDLSRGLYTDKGVTSIHPNAYRVILREQSYEWVNKDKLRNGKYIGHLKSLERLWLQSAAITDVSVILGVADCPRLRTLGLS